MRSMQRRRTLRDTGRWVARRHQLLYVDREYQLVRPRLNPKDRRANLMLLLLREHRHYSLYQKIRLLLGITNHVAYLWAEPYFSRLFLFINREAPLSN